MCYHQVRSYLQAGWRPSEALSSLQDRFCCGPPRGRSTWCLAWGSEWWLAFLLDGWCSLSSPYRASEKQTWYETETGAVCWFVGSKLLLFFCSQYQLIQNGIIYINKNNMWLKIIATKQQNTIINGGWMSWKHIWVTFHYTVKIKCIIYLYTHCWTF